MWTDGVVTTDDGNVVARPRMPLDELRSSPAAAHARVVSDDPGYWSLWIRALTIDQHNCGAVAAFSNSAMKTFYFGMTREEEDKCLGHRPTNYELLDLYRSWLSSKTGSTGTIEAPWGSVSAKFDNRIDEAFILFSYK
jgi:hypothetical protein